MEDLSRSYIPYREIAAQLAIEAGDKVLLTSDILRLAARARKHEKGFSADEFLNSFIRITGPGGTLLIPAYNFDLEDHDRFSIKGTPPMTGALAMAAMKRDDFLRTANPLHSFLVHGRDARILASMANESSFGQDSPFAWMLRNNVKMIFAGTGPAQAMTFTHYVEESMGVRYRKYKKLNLEYTDQNGLTSDRVYKLYRKKAGYTMVLHLLEKKLPEAGLLVKTINGINFSVIECGQVYESIKNDIAENNAASIARFSFALYLRDRIKSVLLNLKIFRTTYGKIRSGKRIY